MIASFKDLEVLKLSALRVTICCSVLKKKKNLKCI